MPLTQINVHVAPILFRKSLSWSTLCFFWQTTEYFNFRVPWLNTTTFMLTIASLITLLILTVRRTCSDSSPEFPLLLYSTAANGCEGRTVVVRGVVLLQVTRLGCRKKEQTLFFFFTLNPRLFILYRNRIALAERALILVSEDTSSKKVQFPTPCDYL